MQRQKKILLGLACILTLGLTGCASHLKQLRLTDMEALALCRPNQQGLQTENRIKAEYGFKQFADNTYSPMVNQELFGHRIHLVVLNDRYNIIYVSGEPNEFAHHFGYLLKAISCHHGVCQAPVNKKQTVKFYKAKIKKSKYTTVVECNKLVN